MSHRNWRLHSTVGRRKVLCFDRYGCAELVVAISNVSARLFELCSFVADDSPCSDVGGCYTADTTATNGTCVQCQSDGRSTSHIANVANHRSLFTANRRSLFTLCVRELMSGPSAR